MSSETVSAQKTLQIGVMLEAVQLTDVAGIDIFGSISKEYVTACKQLMPDLPSFLIEVAPDIKFHFISSSLEPSWTTPGLRFIPTTTYDDCPRDLDILVIGGPLPDHRPAAAAKFMREAAEKTGTIMTICTGAMWLADAGVLKGRQATSNRPLLGSLKQAHPEVEWKDQRWVVDGKFWTAGGAGCGLDMIAEYITQKFDPRLVGFALSGLQLGGWKGQLYDD